MTSQTQAASMVTYVTSVRWDGDSDHALVMDCSDYRLPPARAEFLAKHCKINRYDPIFVPGGPGVITVGEILCLFERERVKLLHSFHQFRRVIGIAHHDCGYYKTKYPHLNSEKRHNQQYADLIKFHADIQVLVPEAGIELYYAAPNADGLVTYVSVRL